MIHRRALFALAAQVGFGGLGGCAALPARAAPGRLLGMQLIDRERGQALAEYRHGGAGWVAGRPGARYAVRLMNRSGGRVLVVLSIDGVNAVSGQSAATSQTGYVLAPWQSADIVGWRKSDAQAAAFYFTALPDSYAARTGRPDDVGVIGAAVFRERVAPPPPAVADEPAPFTGLRREGAARDDGAAERRAADAAASSQAQSPSPGAAPAPAHEQEAARLSSRDRLGTGHGEREHAPIQRTAFERATPYPAEVLQLRYDSHANLVAAGVIVPRRWTPDPFPGYVADPPS